MSEIRMAPTLHWNATGFAVRKGHSCRVLCKTVPDSLGRPYADSGLACTPDGPSGVLGKAFDFAARDARSKWNPFGWHRKDQVKRLRVLQDRHGRKASFLTVIGCIGKVPKNELEQHAFVVGRDCIFKAEQDGDLNLFSNDWSGDPGLAPKDQPYLNNQGEVEVEILIQSVVAVLRLTGFRETKKPIALVHHWRG